MVIPAYNPQASHRRHHRLHRDRQFRQTRPRFFHRYRLHQSLRSPQEEKREGQLLREYLNPLLLRKSHWTRSLKTHIRHLHLHLDPLLRPLRHRRLHQNKQLSH